MRGKSKEIRAGDDGLWGEAWMRDQGEATWEKLRWNAPLTCERSGMSTWSIPTCCDTKEKEGRENGKQNVKPNGKKRKPRHVEKGERRIKKKSHYSMQCMRNKKRENGCTHTHTRTHTHTETLRFWRWCSRWWVRRHL